MDFDVVTYNTLRQAIKARAIRQSSGSAATTSGTWVTLFTLNAKGNIRMIYAHTSSTMSEASLRVTVDGGTPIVFAFNTTYPQDSNALTIALPVINVPFVSTVLVEYTQTNAVSQTGDAFVMWSER